MARKGKNKRQQWRRQQQKAKKKENKERRIGGGRGKRGGRAQKIKETIGVRRVKWFIDRTKLCKQRFKALCDAGTMHDDVNEERDQLIQSVDELADIWAMGKWRDVRRDLLKTFLGHEDINNAIADQMDEQFPDFKRIEMKKIKFKFKLDNDLPFTKEEGNSLITGEWGWAQAVKNLCSQLDDDWYHSKGYMTPQEEKEMYANVETLNIERDCNGVIKLV